VKLQPAHVWLVALGLGAAVFAAYAPALDAGFVNWDDLAGIVDNPKVQGLGAENLRWMFSETYLGPWQPLSWLSLALNHAAAGLDPAAFHATNLALHALASLALFLLAWRLFGAVGALAESYPARFGAALLAALLFAVHPLRCESVCWVTERRDVLSAPFVFLALYVWLGAPAREAGGLARRQLGALALFALALMSKATVVVAPVWMLAVDLWPRQRLARLGWRRLLLEKSGFVLLAAAASAMALIGQKRDAAMMGLEQFGLLDRCVVALHAPTFYLWKTLVPIGLMPCYELQPPGGHLTPRFLVPAAITLAITLLLALRWRRWPAALCAWLAFLATIAPVSGLLQSGPQVAADRYSYLASAPLALFVGGIVARLWLRAPELRTLLSAAAGLVLVALGWAAHQQSRIWHDSLGLWERVLALEPENSTAHENLGSALLKLGQAERTPAAARRRYEGARQHTQRSLDRALHARKHFNLGAIEKNLADLGEADAPERLAAAERQMRAGEAASRQHGFAIDAQAHFNFAAVLRDREQLAEALQHARACVALDPRHGSAWHMAGELSLQLGQAREAVAASERALELAPQGPIQAVILWQLARALEQDGQRPRARQAAERALQLFAPYRARSAGLNKLAGDAEAYLQTSR